MKIRIHFIGLVLTCLLVFSSAVLAGGGDDQTVWRPVTPEELQMKTPKVEPDADAEAIFWEVRMDDKKETRLSYDNYVRVKIFTERGREKFSKFDIPFTKGKTIDNVAARVIKPDGTIIELNPGDIYEREIVKAGKIKVLTKSFAVPGIEPGVIVEYQYKEIYKDSWANGVRLVFQHDIPIQKMVYYVRPEKGFVMNFHYYNFPPNTVFTQDPQDKGFYTAAMNNVPAFKTETNMPPEDEVRRWAYGTYSTYDSVFAWNDMSFDYQRLLQSQVANPSKMVKEKAAELTAGAANDDAKLRRLYEYSQKQIKNINFDKSFTLEERQKMADDTSDDAIKKGAANAIRIELLFGALAFASGFDVGVVLSGDRSENFFDKEKYPYPSFMHRACMAIKVGDKWRLLKPGTPYLPYGRLLWNEEAVNAMLIGSGFTWIRIPSPEPAGSLKKRAGKLKLSEDGTLEGSIRLEYNGQTAITRRREDYFDTEDEIKESVKNEFKARMSSAEITSIAVENFKDNTKPLVYTFDLRVPGYAQRTGKRLFLQPGFFAYGTTPIFASATRVNDISFPYSWSELDEIEWQLPAGFELDNADTPAEIIDQRKISDLRIGMAFNKVNNTLTYHRNFYFGAGGNLLFPVSGYDAMKNLFDEFFKADTHIITLKQTH